MKNVTTQESPDRIELIDVLRGFALLGIIIAHFIDQYFGGPFPSSVASSTDNGIIKTFNENFIEGKFLAIFSFLFGLSFYIQMTGKTNSHLSRFLWRLVVLFLIGFIHHLHYRGDILTTYAILGFVLTVSYRLPNKCIVFLAFFLAINIPATSYHALVFFRQPSETTQLQALPNPSTLHKIKTEIDYFNTLKKGSYAQIIKTNLSRIGQRFKLNIWTGKIFVILGLFLLGYLVGSLRLFENIKRYLPAIRKIFYLSLFGVLVFSGLPYVLIFFYGQGRTFDTLILNSFKDVINLLMAIAYVTAIVLVFQFPRGRVLLMNFCAVGRMGLTTYLLQTFFGFILFFGLGLSLLGKISPFLSFLASLVIFTIQIIFSKWWLSYFQYGPFEWAWRSLTYFKWVRLKK